MSLEVSPLELDFHRPFDHEVSQTISLGNRTNSPVAFKVKTTAPKRYCVRPNSGRIEPGTEVEVQVLLQAMKEEPPLNQKCRDKFLVQSVSVPADKEFSNVSAIWQEADANRDTMKPFERKIKVAFLPAADEEDQQRGQQAPLGDPPAYNAGLPYEGASQGSPGIADSSSIKPGTPSSAAIAAATPPSKYKAYSPGEGKIDRVDPLASSNSAKRSSTDSRSVRTSVDDSAANRDVTILRNQLLEAQAQIERLRDQLADQGLRQRKLPGEEGQDEKTNGIAGELLAAAEDPTALLQSSGERGVQLNIVAILCFVSFLLGYLFF